MPLDVGTSGDIYRLDEAGKLADALARILFLSPAPRHKTLSAEEAALEERFRQEFMAEPPPLPPATRDALVALLAPGTPIGDLLAVLDTGRDQRTRAEAARRLATTWLRCGYVFHPGRWERLRDAFERWRHERPLDTPTREDAWADLATPHILSAAAALHTSAQAALADIRRHVRAGIELELLGHTLDAKAPAMVSLDTPVDEDDETTLADLIPDRGAGGLLELVELRLNLSLRLGEADAELLLKYFDPDTNRTELATRLRMKPATLRKRVERLRHKLLKH